jgi:hypothetical protein
MWRYVRPTHVVRFQINACSLGKCQLGSLALAPPWGIAKRLAWLGRTPGGKPRADRFRTAALAKIGQNSCLKALPRSLFDSCVSALNTDTQLNWPIAGTQFRRGQALWLKTGALQQFHISLLMSP